MTPSYLLSHCERRHPEKGPFNINLAPSQPAEPTCPVVPQPAPGFADGALDVMQKMHQNSLSAMTEQVAQLKRELDQRKDTIGGLETSLRDAANRQPNPQIDQEARHQVEIAQLRQEMESQRRDMEQANEIKMAQLEVQFQQSNLGNLVDDVDDEQKRAETKKDSEHYEALLKRQETFYERQFQLLQENLGAAATPNVKHQAHATPAPADATAGASPPAEKLARAESAVRPKSRGHTLALAHDQVPNKASRPHVHTVGDGAESKQYVTYSIFDHTPAELRQQRITASQRLGKFLSNLSIDDSEAGLDDATYQALKSRLNRAQSQRSYQSMDASEADGTKASEQDLDYYAILDAKKAELERICEAYRGTTDSDDDGDESILQRKPPRNTFAHKMATVSETPDTSSRPATSRGRQKSEPARQATTSTQNAALDGTGDSFVSNGKRIDFSTAEADETLGSKKSSSTKKKKMTRDQLVDKWRPPSNDSKLYTTTVERGKRGLGMAVVQDGKYIRVTKIHPGGCADHAGVAVGEVLLKANSTGLYRATEEQANNIINYGSSGVEFDIVPMEIPLPPDAEQEATIFVPDDQGGESGGSISVTSVSTDEDFDLGSDDDATEGSLAPSIQTVDIETSQNNPTPPPRDTPTPPPRDDGPSSDDFVSTDSSDGNDDMGGSATLEPTQLGEPADLQPMHAGSDDDLDNALENIADQMVTLEPMEQPLSSSVNAFNAPGGSTTVSEMSSQISLADDLAIADLSADLSAESLELSTDSNDSNPLDLDDSQN